MSDAPFTEIRDWLAHTDPAPESPYYRDTRRYLTELLIAYDALARQVEALHGELHHQVAIVTPGERLLSALECPMCIDMKHQLAEATARVKWLEEGVEGVCHWGDLAYQDWLAREPKAR